MLEVLASVRVAEGEPFSSLENLVLDHTAVVSGCICVLLAWDEARQELVRKLRSMRLPVLVLLVVEPGRARPDAGPLRDEPDRFHVLELGRIEQGLAALS
jgi:hypothetical protein